MGIVATIVFVILFGLSIVPGAISQGTSAEGFYTGISAFFLLATILSIPITIVIEAVNQFRSRGSEKAELERIEGKDSMEKLERLNNLKEKGAISQEEFEEKKQDLLDDL